ncbi:SIS domain-containing protein [Vibrio parahaemolyticus]|uniref:SIS domain-containing protein n=1 Tax=Vibrio TaxID=662 RepID=UPI00062BF5AD|nr:MULTISPECIES: SIS domain-containing protein [Vibrio]EGR0771282.1 SIS domain-containing protein [Vibrio parahaemolyticus]EGR0841029.1 SIS domain-containing protein [Vibrio parahaemolyticus]EIO4604834.1 SIS domain-containing protein [Vibrio parahaemolyticus]EJG1582215.1 SIS domain-containing protein [Vibrio parahaemolyticus]ELA7274383.1 SIS domain-containing protein [Vibrio parahaemolyticus]
MNQYLGYSEQDLESLKAFWTAKEVEQQPACWRKTQATFSECFTAIDTFMSKVLAHHDLRIVMTGAGTSAFAGRALAPALAEKTGRRVEAVATTDLVSNPYQYFAEDLPTLLVSFARSGNSPESVAAVELANQCLSDCYHLLLTCNGEGKLYQKSLDDSRCFALLMPEETNDKSFAMTSSFSSMMMAAFSILDHKQDHSKEIERISLCSEGLIKEINIPISNMASMDIRRVIYLGSGGLQGLAQESALKLLELTAGKVVATYDSPLGFRHGPKSIVDKQTLIVVYISNNPYTRQYDLDLLAELRRDKIACKVIAITAQLDEQVISGDYWHVPAMETATDIELLFPYIIFAQIYAFHRALVLGNTPDNPCPTGEVNRVVQGVTIHNFNK